MPRDYWGAFVKDCDRVFRDANGIFKRSAHREFGVGSRHELFSDYETFARNVKNEAVRMEERIEIINRIRETEIEHGRRLENGSAPDESAQKFLELMGTLSKVLDNLQTIQTLCNPLMGENPHVNPGALEDELSSLRMDKEIIKSQINEYRQQRLGAEGTTPQQTFLLQIESILQGRVFSTICMELRNIIDRGDPEEVKQYGTLAGSLLQQVDGIMNVLNWEMRHQNEVVSPGTNILAAEDNQFGNNDVMM